MSITQYLHIAFEFWSAIFCVITAVIVLLTGRFDRKRARSLFGLLVTNAILNVSESLAYLYRGNTSELGYYMVRVTNFLVFFCNFIMLLFFLAYLCGVIEKNSGKKIVFARRMLEIAAGMGILSLVLSRVFHFYYSFDENNNYFRLGSYWLLIAFSEIIMLGVVVITIVNWKHLKLVEKIQFVLFEFLPIVSFIIQAFIYGISLTTIANTVTIIMIFVTYEISYSEYMVTRERRLLEQVITAFAEAIDAKDNYTGGHSSRVAKYSRMLAEKMGLNKEKVEEIYQMALLHDVGKIGVSDLILRKSAKLSEEEYDVIKTHPVKGSEILEHITEKAEWAMGARWHHERYDGTGYPDGLKGEDIPIEGRIICVADSYDAMTSNRSYRKYLPQDVVRSELEKNAGTQFDPEIAKHMIDIIDADKSYRLHERDKRAGFW